MKKAKTLIKKIMKDQRGYGIAELMLIIALLGSIGLGVYSVLKPKMEGSAESVGTNIDNLISNWTNSEGT